MTDRGTYRSIARVLIDGPDFQQLSPQARHVFLTLKIGMGPAGIELRYPRALLEELRHQTGYQEATLTRALAELEAGDWIRRSGHLLWIVGQLEYEPHLQPTNPKHRASVRQHVLGLPRTLLVAQFISRYKPFFTDADTILIAYPALSDSLSNGNGMPSDSPSDHRDRRQRPKTETEDRKPKQRTPPTPPAMAEFEQAWARYPKRVGTNSRRDAETAWRARVAEGIPPATMLAGVERYRAFCDGGGVESPRFVMQAARFFGPGRHFEQPWELEDPMPPKCLPDGTTDNPAWDAWWARQQRKPAGIA